MAHRPGTIFALAAALLVGGCGDDDESGTQPPVEPSDCAAPAVALPDGSCLRPGVAPDGCGEGLAHDGAYGCTPILPTEPCPYGLMAIPGETLCRAVMPCGDGRWGDIPIDANTIHVDESYAGGSSDGSEAMPFTTIAEGLAGAAAGQLIAVAAGRYQEDLVISGKPVKLSGRCPEMVEVVGAGLEFGTLSITTAANGTQVSGIAFGGPAAGVLLSGSAEIVLERLWVRDNARAGIVADSMYGTTSLRVSDTLVEQNNEFGVIALGSELVIERSVVRTTGPRATDKRKGHGVSIQVPCTNNACNAGARSFVTLRRALVDDNHELGVFVAGSDAVLESAVVRGTQPRVSDQTSGRGVSIQGACSAAGCDPTSRANVTLDGVYIEGNHHIGLSISGSDVVARRTVVRDTKPQVSDATGGRGINIQSQCFADLCDATARADVTIDSSLIDNNHVVGLHVTSSDAVIDNTVVRATLPQASDQHFGRGVNIQLPCPASGCDPSGRSNVIVRNSLVERCHEIGLLVMGSDTIVENSAVRGTLTRAGTALFGDGMAVFSEHAVATAELSHVLIDESARSGIANFGASVALATSEIRCGAYALNGEQHDGHDFDFDDAGGNACGCPTAVDACKVISIGLEPPEAPPF